MEAQTQTQVLNPAVMKKMRETLISKRTQLTRDFSRAQRTAREPTADDKDRQTAVSSHWADQCSNNGFVNHADTRVGILDGEIARINLALRRIDGGTFGICMSCKEKIPLERLEVIPAADKCVSCQEQLEMGQGKGRNYS